MSFYNFVKNENIFPEDLVAKRGLNSSFYLLLYIFFFRDVYSTMNIMKIILFGRFAKESFVVAHLSGFEYQKNKAKGWISKHWHTTHPSRNYYEIIMDILSRLPIYSLFQCTLVSKAWRDIIIHNPIFATMQHSRALEYQNSILLMFSQDNSPEVNLYLVEREEAGHRKLRVMDAKLTNHTRFNGPLRILGSCNGLLCISFGAMDGPLYVSNPITGECKQLPSKESKYIHISGIGFDSVRKEYKVVRRVSKYDLPYMVDDCSWKVEIHTLGTNTWREIGNFPWWDGKDLLYKFSDVLVNGRLHWCSFFPTPVRITSLDMSDVQFGVVPTPEFTSRCHLHLMTWKGSLTIAQRLRGDLSIHIWVMKEYSVRESWTKQFNVTMPTWFYAGMNYWPFDDESLIDDIQVIDHPRLRAEYYNNSPRCYLGVMAHLGSLVSLKNYHGKEKAG